MAHESPLPIPEGFDELSIEEKRDFVRRLLRRVREEEVRASEEPSEDLVATLQRRADEMQRTPERQLSVDEVFGPLREKYGAR